MDYESPYQVAHMYRRDQVLNFHISNEPAQKVGLMNRIYEIGLNLEGGHMFNRLLDAV